MKIVFGIINALLKDETSGTLIVVFSKLLYVYLAHWNTVGDKLPGKDEILDFMREKLPATPEACTEKVKLYLRFQWFKR